MKGWGVSTATRPPEGSSTAPAAPGPQSRDRARKDALAGAGLAVELDPVPGGGDEVGMGNEGAALRVLEAQPGDMEGVVLRSCRERRRPLALGRRVEGVGQLHHAAAEANHSATRQ